MVEINVLHQDLALLVVNKPAGLSTLPDGYNPTLPHIKSVLEGQYGRLWIVHRLDKETSGVLILARTAEAHRLLNNQFEQHQAVKVYHALVAGRPEWKSKIADLPLRANGDRHHRTIVDLQTGKPAITTFKVIERFRDYALVEARPETGRTHQIRAHLAALGLPILGDKLYGHALARSVTNDEHAFEPVREPLLELAAGIGLHARSLEVAHPVSGERLKFTAPYPEYFLAVLQKLRSLADFEEHSPV